MRPNLTLPRGDSHRQLNGRTDIFAEPRQLWEFREFVIPRSLLVVQMT
jgi:hypothetical protein